MNQNEWKQSNATHNQQQWFSTNFSLPCPQPGKFWQSLYWRKRLYLLGHFEDEYLMVMSYIYRHTQAGVGSISMASAAEFCLHKLLFSAGTLLFSEDATYAYVAPCYYLHSTAARSKITDCPSAPCPFWPRSSHVSFLPPFTQSAVAISPTPHRQHVTVCGPWLDLSDLQIWNWPLQSACEPISLNAYARVCTLGIFSDHSTSLLTSHTLCRPLVTESTCCFTLVLIPQHLTPLTLRYSNCFETDCLF